MRLLTNQKESNSGYYNNISRILRLFETFYWRIIYKGYHKKYDIDPTFRFNGPNIEVFGEGSIRFGKNSYIGRNSIIQCSKDCSIIIGDNCSISHYLKIYTANYSSEDIISEKNEIRLRKGNVKIGDNCWIGLNVFIREGINIGNNCVIGAHSVVVHDVPNNTLIAGNPARIIKKYDKKKDKIEYFNTV